MNDDRKLEDALEWARVMLDNMLDGARESPYLQILSDAASRAQESEEELNDYLERDERGRDEIVRETVERCASACEQLSARYSDTFAVVMAESVEDNRARIARMETCEQAASEIRSLVPNQPVKE